MDKLRTLTDLSGSVLDLASGPFSLGYLYRDVVSVDINPQYIKEVRSRNHKGVMADIYDLPFEPKRFDYVVAIDPPLVPMGLHRNGSVRFTIDPEATRKLVEEALRVAKKNVVIISYFVARFPPHPEMIEKRMPHPPYYVIYRANGEVSGTGKI
jgi:SAM-dependent methyltransferase